MATGAVYLPSPLSYLRMFIKEIYRCQLFVCLLGRKEEIKRQIKVRGGALKKKFLKKLLKRHECTWLNKYVS